MKFLSLSIAAAVSLVMYACGSEEPPAPPPLPALIQTQAPTPDIQATVDAGVQATVAAANLRATAEAQVAPTDTPAPPTATQAPPTNTPEPTAVLATSTPEPTATDTPRPTLTPTPTPLPYGFDWDNPVPIGEYFVLQNNEGISLRVREAMVFWGNKAWDLIDAEHNLNDRAPYGHEYLLINIQVKGHAADADAYDAADRLTVEANPYVKTLYPNDGIYKWLGANHCGGQVDTVIPRDFSLERYTGEENGRRGNICFIVTRDDSGKLVLVDNGGPGAPPEDRRFWALR